MNKDPPLDQRVGNRPSSDALPDWAEPVNTCLRRSRCWRVPSNWCVPDWFQEMRSVAKLAALEAAGAFDPARGTAFGAFVRSRALARALTFYRKEWTYAIRHIDGVSLSEDQERLPPEQCLFAPDTSSDPARDNLCEALALLPKQAHWLLEELYLHERTEADLGRQLGITQRAVSKRKHSALCRLRRHLGQQSWRATDRSNRRDCKRSAEVSVCGRNLIAGLQPSKVLTNEVSESGS